MNIPGNNLKILLVLGVAVGMVSVEGHAFSPSSPGGYYNGGYPPGGAPRQFWAGPVMPYGYGPPPFQGRPGFPRVHISQVRRPGGVSISFRFCAGNGNRGLGGRGYGPPPGYPPMF